MKTSFLVNMFDIYGQQINMQIFGSDKKRSVFGAFMGVLSMALMSAVTIYFVVGLWQRNTKQIISNQDTTVNPYNNFTEFPIFFTLLQANGVYPPNDGSYFNFHAFKLANNYTNSVYYGAAFIPINLQVCTQDTWGGKFTFPNDTVSPYRMCIKAGDINFYNNINNFKDGWNSLQVIVSRCNPSKNPNCASKEKIDAAFEGAYFSFGSYFSTIDNNNLTSPGQYGIATTYVSLSNTLYKKMTVKLTQVLYQDDNGFVFESFDTHNFFTLGDVSTDISTGYPASYLNLAGGATPVGSFSISNSPFVQKYYRSFMKAQVVLANIGGMIKFLMVLSGFINNFVTRKLAYAAIGNLLFDYKTTSNKIKGAIPIAGRGVSNNQELKGINSNLNDHVEINKEKNCEEVREKCPPGNKTDRTQVVKFSLRSRKINIQKTVLRPSSNYFNFSLRDMICSTGWATNKRVMKNYELTQAAILKKASIDSIASDSYKLNELCKLTLSDDQFYNLKYQRVSFKPEEN